MKITDYTLFDGTPSFIIEAEEGKMLVRKSDNKRFGGELSLGFVYYLNDEKLDEPHWETPEDYEEDDMTPEELAEMERIAEMEEKANEVVDGDTTDENVDDVEQPVSEEPVEEPVEEIVDEAEEVEQPTDDAEEEEHVEENSETAE